MFGFGKQKTSEIVFIDKKRSIDLSQVFVVSMRQDLENILKGNSNPTLPPQNKPAPVANTDRNNAPRLDFSQNMLQNTPQNNPAQLPKFPQNQSNALSEKYKTSPFLNPNDKIEEQKNEVSFQVIQNKSDANRHSFKETLTKNPTLNQQNYTQNTGSLNESAMNTAVPSSAQFQKENEEKNNTQLNQTDLQKKIFQTEPKILSEKVQPPNIDARQNLPKQPLIKPSFKSNLSLNLSAQSNQLVQTSVKPSPNLPINPEAQKNLDDKNIPQNNKRERRGPSWGKLLFSAILLFVVLIFAVLGWYFWLTKKSESHSFYQYNNQENTTAPKESSFLIGQNNSIYLDINNLDKYQIKNTFNKYASDVIQSNIREPIGFSLQNQQKNPVKFELLIDKLEIKLPPSLIKSLDSEFVLFAYNDNQKPFLGLSINSKNGSALSEALIGEELSLAKNFDFLYLTSGYDINGKNFEEDSYGGAEIRCLNIDSEEGLSFNYSIYKNRLLIGTSKMTLRSMIDYLASDDSV